MASPALGVRFERTMDYRAAGTSLTTSQVGHLAMDDDIELHSIIITLAFVGLASGNVAIKRRTLARACSEKVARLF